MIKEPLPWFAHYPEGVNHEINPDRYSSVVQILEESVAKFW